MNHKLNRLIRHDTAVTSERKVHAWFFFASHEETLIYHHHSINATRTGLVLYYLNTNKQFFNSAGNVVHSTQFALKFPKDYFNDYT